MVVLVFMGVCGCGKTSVAETMTNMFAADFHDADDFHPQRNKKKMADGQPLNDDDRLPWLQAIRSAIEHGIHTNKVCIITCSALRKCYRDILRGNRSYTDTALGSSSSLVFVHLLLPRDLVIERVSARHGAGSQKGSFFPVTLVDNQFATLERPDTAVETDVLEVDATGSLQQVQKRVLEGLQNRGLHPLDCKFDAGSKDNGAWSCSNSCLKSAEALCLTACWNSLPPYTGCIFLKKMLPKRWHDGFSAKE
eukprot:gnl/MRDRNA2_/MRDRNA2_322212_c0_seq1.p1 gnl/MRDRNA2_/MRDRNA2_322212_c0~~gnl/MRDRNA2_/MRDRNA2_322212_c0_seq1.p1  ORF type:complete len:251 (-),score=28.74 gnl/MRDRNA2_/MRDRNA2_322212_c0_seq1:40-792(-)